MEMVVRAAARREDDPQHHDMLVAEYGPVIDGLLDRHDFLILRCRWQGDGASHEKCHKQVSHMKFLPCGSCGELVRLMPAETRTDQIKPFPPILSICVIQHRRDRLDECVVLR